MLQPKLFYCLKFTTMFQNLQAPDKSLDLKISILVGNPYLLPATALWAGRSAGLPATETKFPETFSGSPRILVYH